MVDVTSLANRIDSDFAEVQKRIDAFQKEAEQPQSRTGGS